MDVKFKHVCTETDRHGTVRHYYRKGKGSRTLLPGQPGSQEWLQAYNAAKASTPRPEPVRRHPSILKGTLRWLCVEYFRSDEFFDLDERTQRVRRQIIEHCLQEPITPESDLLFADFPLKKLTPRAIKVLRTRKRETPAAANSRVKALRQVFGWGMEEEDERGRPLMDRNPAREVAYLKESPEGHHSWTMAEVEQYEAKHPVGSKARLALSLLLYTMQRRSDVARFGKQHIRMNPAFDPTDPECGEFERSLAFTQFKGRNRKPVTLEVPIIPELWRIIGASPTGDLTFLVTEFKKGFSDAGFGNKMRQWCDEAGLTHCSAHGLRKAGLARLADLGLTDRQIMSISGHQTEKEVTRYTRAADQKRLAKAGMKVLARNVG